MSLCTLRLYLSSTLSSSCSVLFFFNATATTEIYTLSLHDALPICADPVPSSVGRGLGSRRCLLDWNLPIQKARSEEHTSELQSLRHLVCRLLLEKKK